MADNKKISVAVIKRLPRYYRYLGDLLNVGIVRISSKELSEKMNITASQIRQDLNNFGGFGQRDPSSCPPGPIGTCRGQDAAVRCHDTGQAALLRASDTVAPGPVFHARAATVPGTEAADRRADHRGDQTDQPCQMAADHLPEHDGGRSPPVYQQTCHAAETAKTRDRRKHHPHLFPVNGIGCGFLHAGRGGSPE